MTITTTLSEHMAIAKRYEAEGRWAQAAEAYDAAIATFRHPMDKNVQGDIAYLQQLRIAAVQRSREGAPAMTTPASEEVKKRTDDAGAAIANASATP